MREKDHQRPAIIKFLLGVYLDMKKDRLLEIVMQHWCAGTPAVASWRSASFFSEAPAAFSLQFAVPADVTGLEHSSTPDEAESECMVCLVRPPTFVFEKCGHFGVCGKCWKYMCKSPAALVMEKVADAKLMCPYCRAVTRAVHHSRYSGTEFYPV